MTYALGARSRRELEGVHPLLRDVTQMAITITEQDFSVIDGVRTIEEQKDNVRRGVSRTMFSNHLIQPDGLGHAVDLVPYVNGHSRWEIDLCCVIADAVRVSAIELGASIVWGGAWVSLTSTIPLRSPRELVDAYVKRKVLKGKRVFIDGPHYEIHL